MTEYFDLVKNERIVQYDGMNGRVAHESCAVSAGWKIDDELTGTPPLGCFWMCMVCKHYFNLTARESSPPEIHFI